MNPTETGSLFPANRGKWLEEEFQSQGFKYIVGIDEAGRGPLAGPVIAAAVLLPPDKINSIEGLTDSKKLTENNRRDLFDRIRKEALAIGIGSVSPPEIDQINILQASLKAMKLALEQLLKTSPIRPKLVLIDGKQSCQTPPELKAIPVVKGDSLSANIAAASIIAKVTRDQIMEGYSKLFPEYQFQKNRGYPTREHYTQLEKFGPSPIHRLSFKGVLKK